MENQTAQTILQQLGGNKFIAMTGANSFVADGDSLRFSIPKHRGINKVLVILDPEDTYTMKFWNMRPSPNFKIEEKIAESGLYADMLQFTFTEHTGLDTHM